MSRVALDNVFPIIFRTDLVILLAFLGGCCKGRSHGSLNVPIEHHPTIRYMVYNGYYKVMSNSPKMGHLPIPGSCVKETQVVPSSNLICIFLGSFSCAGGSRTGLSASGCTFRRKTAGLGLGQNPISTLLFTSIYIYTYYYIIL